MKNLLKKLPRWFPIVFAAVVGMTAQFFISTAIGNMMGIYAFVALRAVSIVFVWFGVFLLIAELAGIFISDRLIRQNNLQAADRARVFSSIAVGIILAVMLIMTVALPSLSMRILYVSPEVYNTASELLAAAGLSFMIVTLLAFLVGNVAFKKESPILTSALSFGLLLFSCVFAVLQLFGLLAGMATLKSASFAQGILFACSLIVPYALMPLRTHGHANGTSSSRPASTYTYLEEYKRNHR